jgi:hypothetical protein
MALEVEKSVEKVRRKSPKPLLDLVQMTDKAPTKDGPCEGQVQLPREKMQPSGTTEILFTRTEFGAQSWDNLSDGTCRQTLAVFIFLWC